MNIAVRGEVNDPNSNLNYAGSFTSFNGPVGGFNFGINASAFGSGTNYGVFSTVSGSSGTTPPSGPNYAGYFNGDVYISGTFGPSDQNLKTNIQDVNGALALIDQMQPKAFEYDNSTYPSMNLSSGNQYGLIAQDIEQFLPELVSTNTQPAVIDSNGVTIHPAVNFKGLEYQQIIPILVGGVKEQQAIIATQDSLIGDLQSQINQLYTMMMACCESNQAMQLNGTGGSDENGFSNSINVELNETQSIVLEQNVPNPFAEQTTINFSLPTSVEKAQMLFYNIEGKLIKSVDINERGASRINVFASDLSNGIYTYTLVADGEIVDTKRMVKQ